LWRSFGTEIVMHARFELEPVLKEIAKKRITVFFGVPTMIHGMLSYPGIETIDLSSLKYCGPGGAPLPVEVSQRFKEKTGCDIFAGGYFHARGPSGQTGLLRHSLPRDHDQIHQRRQSRSGRSARC
jgi:long-chain acyl-CoA synthetase